MPLAVPARYSDPPSGLIASWRMESVPPRPTLETITVGVAGAVEASSTLTVDAPVSLPTTSQSGCAGVVANVAPCMRTLLSVSAVEPSSGTLAR